MIRTRILSGVLGFGVLAVGLQLSFACNNVSETNYGNANGLSLANLPGEAGAAGGTCDTSALRFDGGSCPTFANDIFPYMQGSWACVSGGCHGGPTQPKMSPVNAGASLASLRLTTVAGKNYLPTAAGGDDAGDLAVSTSFLCNVQGTCGQKMPKSPGTDLTSAEVCLVTAWINCGAPP